MIHKIVNKAIDRVIKDIKLFESDVQYYLKYNRIIGFVKHVKNLIKETRKLESDLICEKTIPRDAICYVCGKKATLGYKSATYWCSRKCRDSK